MTSLKLLSLASNRKNVPTLNGSALSRSERICAKENICVICRARPQTDTSFRCSACEAADTSDAIAEDIKAIRQQILGAEPNKH